MKRKLYRILAVTVGLALLLATGCAVPANRPDPLTGWHFSSLNNLDSNKAISDDYRDYIQKLSPEERKFVGSVKFFEDGTGRHAVKIEIDLHGTWWEHVLIYDRDNKRTKVIKYVGGRYRS